MSLLFNLASPFTLLHQRSMGLCIRKDLEARSLHLGDAFIAINASHSGQLSPDEVWGGMRFCRLTGITAQDVLDFIQVADTHHEGTIQYPDFLSILTGKSEIEDDDTGTKEDLLSKKLPTVDPFGAEELKELRSSREKQRRKEEEEANKDMASEDKRVRDEIEQEQMREELNLIQTCPNPHLHEKSLHFSFETNDVPKLSQYFGVIKPRQKERDDGPMFFSLNEDSIIKLLLRSIKLLRNNPILDRYMFTFEYCLPRPATAAGKEAKMRLLEMLDADGEEQPLIDFKSNVWQLCQAYTIGVAAGAGDDGGDDNPNENEERSEDDSRGDDGHQSTTMYIYSAPEKEKKNRVARVTMSQNVQEVPGERMSTSSGSVSIEWMKVCRPKEGWVPFDEGGKKHWKRESVTFSLNNSTSLFIRVNYLLDHALRETQFEEVKKKKEDDESSSSDGELWDWHFMDDFDANEGEEEQEEQDEQFDMGDLTDLVAALKKAKELKPGDKVTRNPECWDKGNEDGGEGTIGKVVSVEESSVAVQWPNGHKGSYSWGTQGKFELIKVGEASEEDEVDREVENDDQWGSLLTHKQRTNCSHCGQNVNTDTGWYKCNACPNFSLCKKCFAQMDHIEHIFTNMKTLSDMVKSTLIIRGSAVRIRSDVKEPAHGWGDAPRDGTPGVVTDLDEDAGTATVTFGDDTWNGMLRELEVVDSKYEQYATSWLGSLVNLSRYDRKMLPVVTSVLDVSLIPQDVVGKFKIGDSVKARWKHNTVYPGEIKAVLPNRKYAIAFQDGDYEPQEPEDEIWIFPFKVGTKVRMKAGVECLALDDKNRVPPGVAGVVETVNQYSGESMEIQVKFRSGMRSVVIDFVDSELVVVGVGKWMLEKGPGQPLLPLPNSANVSIEKSFSDGLPQTEEMYIRDGSYIVNFRTMSLVSCKTNDIIGKVVRDPPEEWVEQREKVLLDDPKWHVLSVIVNKNEDVVVLCDGRNVSIGYDGPENGDENENEEGEEAEEACEETNDAKVEEKEEVVAESNEEYAARLCLPNVLDHMVRCILTDRPQDPLQHLLTSLGALSEEDQKQLCHKEQVEEEVEKDGENAGGEHEEDDGENEEANDENGEGEEEEEGGEKGEEAEGGEKDAVVDHERDKEHANEQQPDDEACDEEAESQSTASHDSKIERIGSLKRDVGEVLALDVRNALSIFPFCGRNISQLRAKYGASLPQRRLAKLIVSWDDEASSDNAKKIFGELDEASRWICPHCGAKTSRLQDDCSGCKKPHFETAGKGDGIKLKMHAVMPKSREATDFRKKMHARLRQQYQKQLEALEDYSTVL